MILAPYLAAAHLESAAIHLERAAEELSGVDAVLAVHLLFQAGNLRRRAARLEAEYRAQLAADEASFRAYDAAHPQPGT